MSRYIVPAKRFMRMVGVLTVCLLTLAATPAGAGVGYGIAHGEAARVELVQARPNAPPPAPNVEANIATLRQRLQITPGQETQFSAVANVMRENARAGASVPQQPPANATAVDDLRAEIQYDEVELAGLKRLLPALEALYSTLSPAQKKMADAVFRQGPGG
jgi:LTXXQ motif family protein